MAKISSAADDADRGAEEPRRVAAEAEAPPEIVRVLDVLVAEEAEPRGGDEHEQNRGDPARAEALVERAMPRR